MSEILPLPVKAIPLPYDILIKDCLSQPLKCVKSQQSTLQRFFCSKTILSTKITSDIANVIIVTKVPY